MNWPESDRLFYKKTDLGDAPDFYAICKNKGVASLANIRALKNLHDAESVVEMFDFSRDARTIKSKDTKETIGFISSREFRQFKVKGYPQQYEISLMIFPRHQEKGYGKESLEWFIKETLKKHPSSIVICKIYEDNEKSAKMASKYMKKIKSLESDRNIMYLATNKEYFEKKLKQIERTKNGR